jgi:hypothetical protein
VNSVGESTAADRRWQALADELAPAKSLQRLDAAGARVVSTVSVVATVLTGLGLLAAGLSNLPGLGRGLAVVAAVLAVAALLAALRGQTVTVTRGLNLDNRPEVEEWFAEQFRRRSRVARWATGLLVAAVGCAGLAAVVSLLVGGNEAPTLAVTRTADAVTVDLTFRGLDPDQVATAMKTIDGQVVALAAFGPRADGTATRTLAVAKVPAGGAVVIEAQAGGATCTATLKPGAPPAVTCRAS